MADFSDFQKTDLAVIVREDSNFKRSEEVKVLEVRNGKLKVTNGTVEDWIDPRQVEKVGKREKQDFKKLTPQRGITQDGCVYHTEWGEMYNKYPKIADAFADIQDDMCDIFAKKMLDYGRENISMGTSLQSEEERRVALTAIWTRMWDKMNRLKNLVVSNNEAMVDEKIEDTYLDLANYAVISLIVKGGDWK